MLNCGHAVVRQLVRDSVLHLAGDYQVDGFCFLDAESMTHGESSAFVTLGRVEGLRMCLHGSFNTR